jgi:hypothetical protein
MHVAVALWFLKGVKQGNVIKLNGTTLRLLGVHRQAGYSALKRLESAGLVTVERATGRNPIVTILDTEGE